MVFGTQKKCLELCAIYIEIFFFKGYLISLIDWIVFFIMNKKIELYVAPSTNIYIYIYRSIFSFKFSQDSENPLMNL